MINRRPFLNIQYYPRKLPLGEVFFQKPLSRRVLRILGAFRCPSPPGEDAIRHENKAIPYYSYRMAICSMRKNIRFVCRVSFFCISLDIYP